MMAEHLARLRMNDFNQAKGKRGPKSYEPTDKEKNQVRLMAAMGIPQKNIAKIIGLSDESLRKHFRDDLDTGMDRANLAVGSNLFNIATSSKAGNVSAAIFWLKTRARWSDTTKMELTGPDGGPIKTEVNLAGELSVLDKNTLIELQEVLARSDDVEDYDEDEE